MTETHSITVLDVNKFSYAERVCAATLQGLVNRISPSIYLDYGVYDDPTARRTNENFLDDEIWYAKYRDLLGNQDQRNLDYYQNKYDLIISSVSDLNELISQHIDSIAGLIIWDEDFPDTANIALMMAAQENLLPVTNSIIDQLSSIKLDIKHDLRKRWPDRISLYRWAYENLFTECKPGYLACIEPGWGRAEFLDYVVQHKIFVYSLSSTTGRLGNQLLLLLVFGPPRLREFLFALSLDKLVRKFALFWMGLRSQEVKLSNRVQHSVKAKPYPTIFGWHTCRDDELAFMLQLSSNGLRLVPAHLAGNFSFHSKLPSSGIQQMQPSSQVLLDPQGIYLTFTLSDGDQLMMMHTGELGNWYSPQRGSVPFNWETQPLLNEIAPALFEKYISTATEKDCLIAGPSGAGYIVPPLAPNLIAYMKETARVCEQSGIHVVTTYVADPPARVLRNLAIHRGEIIGYLAGYAVVTRAPSQLVRGVPIIVNLFPKVDQIWLRAEDLLTKIHEEIMNQQTCPVFIGVHLFAYRTSYNDIVKFVQEIQNDHIHIVRGDDFLELARQHMQESNK
ncbi:MAG: GxGYxYP family putative glycoside hydrolase [Anaerolineaceae bacterium]|nr:GxGYxYP family putative glycoside hydrolase [Anaerolineaceae bacterium]